MNIHVIGAGLAGLAAAVRALKSGHKVTLWEAAPQAGGRCRSHLDPQLGREIDNGNHLILSGNRAVLGYLRDIGATDQLIGPMQAEFPFVDLQTGEKWCLRPGNGRLPWWLLSRRKRVLASRAWNYLEALSLIRAAPSKTVTDCVDVRGPLYRRFWEPLSLAVLNTKPSCASARLLGAVLAQTFGRGGSACRALLARTTLKSAFIDPALATVARLGGHIEFGARLRKLDIADRQLRGLKFDKQSIALSDDDRVILAVPPDQAASLESRLTPPFVHNAILNAHFILPERRAPIEIIGLIGGLAQWIFIRDDLASVTISAADDSVIDSPASELAAILWAEVGTALNLAAAPLGPYRIIKERRATIAQSPAQTGRRPTTHTAFDSLFLAGDWVDTGLPCTLESAVMSGNMAADAAVSLGSAQTRKVS